MRLYLDIETAPLPSVGPLVAEWLDDKATDHRLKNPVADPAKRDKAASLNPWGGRIVAIGFAWGDESPLVLLTETCPESEMLRMWVKDIRRHTPEAIVTYNGFSFDLPYLRFRLAVYDLLAEAPQWLHLPRYATEQVDWCDRLSCFGRGTMVGLDVICEALGVPGPSGHGADIPAAVAAGDWPTVKAHCLTDVCSLRAIDERLGVL